MSRILVGWELGAGTGHLQMVGAVAHALRERGHEPVFAVRDVATAQGVLGHLGCPVLAAPVWLGHVSGLPPAASYAEVLMRCGYLDAEVVRGVVRAWLALIDLVRPDAVVLEHAPTALLAARLTELPCHVIGTGFSVPPKVAPMPDLQPWQPLDPGRVAAAEAQVVEVINAALAPLGGLPLRCLADLLEVEDTHLCTFAELDHYPHRPGRPDYHGPLMVPRGQPRPPWPEAEGDRVYLYLHHGYRNFQEVVRQLQSLELPLLVVAPGIMADAAAALETPRCRVVAHGVDLQVVGREAAVAVSHAAHGTVGELMRAGCPQVLVPHFVEQAVLGWHFSRHGAAAMTSGEGPGTFADCVDRVVGEPSFRRHAQAIAERYRSFDAAAALARLGDRLDQSLRQPR
ncbi:MAG: hypothetical protein H6983_21285 [Ectothiorhodospiraceae bacterium]|nr:hypothetical protein [Chromatiales bacterium]MCP5156723.1 hypothetical protein [Ectothiorhodospiraceae bacterium]